MKKSNVKGKISGYNELVAIKRELSKNISKQEKSFNNDIMSIDNVYNTTMTFFKRRKNKKKVFDNSNVLMLSDLITQFAEPYIKDKKQKQVYLPAVSFGISFFVTNLLNRGFQKKQST